MKKVILIFVISVLSIVTSLLNNLPVLAKEDSGVIIKVYMDYFDGDISCYLNEAEEYLISFQNNNYEIPAIIEYEDQSTEVIWLPLHWQVNTNPVEIGRYTLTGVIDYTGYKLATEFGAYVTQDFLFVADVIEGEKQTLTKIVLLNIINTEMIRVGDEKALDYYLSDELFMFVQAIAITDDELADASLEIDSIESKVDINKPGTYEVITHFKLSDEDAEKFILSEELTTLKSYICVYDPTQLQITYGCKTNNLFTLFLSQSVIPDNLQVNIMTSQFQLSNEELLLLDWNQYNDFIAFNMPRINFPMSLLKENKFVYIQIQQNNQISNILELHNAPDNIIFNEIEGNRDGGDSEDEDVDPPLTQLPPSIDDNKNEDIQEQEKEDLPTLEIPKESDVSNKSDIIIDHVLNNQDLISNNEEITIKPNIKQTEAYEEVTNNTLKINGVRVQHLLDQYDSWIPFGLNNIQIELSHQFLNSLYLSSSDMLSLIIINKDNNSFSIGLTLNDEVIIDIPRSRITLVINNTVENLYYEENPINTSFIYNGSYVTFLIDYTGDYQYTLMEQNISQENKTYAINEFNYLPVITTGIGIIIVVGILIKRKVL